MNPEISATNRPVDRVARSPFLDRLSDVVQPAVNRLLARPEHGTFAINDFLHGRWLGHALHPIATDIPIGAWSMTAAFDALALAGKRDLEPGADVALVVGIAGAIAAALTGFAEWSDTRDEPRRLGMAHAALNSSALACYVASSVLRRTGRRNAGIALAFAGLGMTSTAAYLGGELAFGYALGVKHTAEPIDPPDDFAPVCDASALADGETRPAYFNDVPVLLSRRGDRVTAVAATCTHRGAPLREASMADDCVTCPWHGSTFDVLDGTVREGPATFGLARFDARLREDTIELRRPYGTPS